MLALLPFVADERWRRAADVAVLGIVASLPWSTSGTSALLVVWLVLVLPQTEWRLLLQEIRRPASAFALALFVLTVLSVLWSGGAVQERWNGVAAAAKLAIIPVLLLHVARRPHVVDQALRVFLVSTTLLMVLSWISLLVVIPPSRLLAMLTPGVPVKDWISQTNFFLMAAFACAHLAYSACARNERTHAVFHIGLAMAFIANLMFIHPSRTGLVILPVLILLFMIQRTGARRGALIGLIAAILACLMLWQASDSIRQRVESAVSEVQAYSARGEATSAGYRLEWYKQSLGLVAHSPLVGYGAGGVRVALEDMVRSGTLEAKFVTSNPHNQVLQTTLQTGLIGLALLLAMWATHVNLLAGNSLAARIGLALVVQNIIGGFFNSHLTDFTQGWMYVVGVGMTLAAARTQASTTANG